MADRAGKRLTAKLRLAESDDGRVRVEIVTSRPLGDAHLRDGSTLTPDEFLRMPGRFQFNTSGGPDGRWRYPDVRAGVVVDSGPMRLIQRKFDLSQGSEERRLLAALTEQENAVVAWVNERVEVVEELKPVIRDAWREALESTRGVTAAQWREELADYDWRMSDSWRPGPRPRRYRRRSMSPPAAPIPFFAGRSGAIPAAGRPELAGITLPAGKRYPSRPAAYWASHEPVPQLAKLAGALASAFPTTGVWPLLWQGEEDPDSYMYGSGDHDAIDAVDVTAVLTERWDELTLDPAATAPYTTFPGLAPGSPVSEKPPDAPDNPFLTMALPEARLLLVPCNRPADVVTQLGGLACELDAPIISAVLRSWETRFATTPLEVAPSAIQLAVSAPPATQDQALALAAEHLALCQTNDARHPGWLHDMADILLGHPPASGSRPPAELHSSREHWDIAWLD